MTKKDIEGTSIVLLEPDALTTIYDDKNGMDAVLKYIEKKALEEKFDLSTSEGRKGQKGVAYLVSRSKTAIVEHGKLKTEEWRKLTGEVNAKKNKAETFLDELRDKLKAPVLKVEKEIAEALVAIQERLAVIVDCAADWMDASEEIQAKIDQIQKIPMDDTWDELLTVAEDAKASTLKSLSKTLTMAKAREEQASEMAALKKAEAERQEADRIEQKRKAEEQAEADRLEAKQKAEADAAAKLASDQSLRADKALLKIAGAIEGNVNGNARPLAVAMDHLKTDFAEDYGIRASEVELARFKAEFALGARVKEEADRIAETQKAEQERQAALAKEAEAKAVEEARKEAEADKLAAEAERKAEAERLETERLRRIADQDNRDRIHAEISEDLAKMEGNATPDKIAQALIDGRIRHVSVEM